MIRLDTNYSKVAARSCAGGTVIALLNLMAKVAGLLGLLATGCCRCTCNGTMLPAVGEYAATVSVNNPGCIVVLDKPEFDLLEIDSTNAIFLLTGRIGDGKSFQFDNPDWEAARKLEESDPKRATEAWTAILQANPLAECAHAHRLLACVTAEQYEDAYIEYIWVQKNASNMLMIGETMGEPETNLMMLKLNKEEEYLWDFISEISWKETHCPNDYRLFCAYYKLCGFVEEWHNCPPRYKDILTIMLSSSLSRLDKYSGTIADNYKKGISNVLKKIQIDGASTQDK